MTFWLHILDPKCLVVDSRRFFIKMGSRLREYRLRDFTQLTSQYSVWKRKGPSPKIEGDVAKSQLRVTPGPAGSDITNSSTISLNSLFVCFRKRQVKSLPPHCQVQERAWFIQMHMQGRTGGRRILGRRRQGMPAQSR